MGNLIWRIRQMISSLMPFLVVGVIAYGGYTFYRQGVFRRGVGPAVSQMLQKLPYFGSRFRHYSFGSGKSYSYAPARSYRRAGKASRRSRGYHHGRRRSSRRR